jgi:hypothetical protein
VNLRRNSALGRNSALACTIICLLASPATAGLSAARPDQPSLGSVTRAYSHIDDVRANKTGLCRTVSVSGYKEDPVVEERCPAGPNGWPVTMMSADARVNVWFGRQAKNGTTVFDALKGGFADPHSTIEWRLLNGKPFAAIHRYYFNGQQALTIHRLNDDMTSCVAAVVSVEHGLDANAEAVRLADEVVPAFRCARDKMIVVGHIADPG